MIDQNRGGLSGIGLPALCLGIGLAVAYPAPEAESAGFYIQEQSVQALGSAFSGSVSNLEDPSTIYFNPAGMTRLQGTQTQLGVHLLIPEAELTDTGSTFPPGQTAGDDGGNPYEPTPVPNGFVSYEIGRGLWAGLGITAPFGLANDYGDSWFGRYDSTKTELLTLDFQPTLAYKINEKFSIGAGLNIQYADAELNSAVFGGTEGTSSMTGDDISYGYNLGIQVRPVPSTTIGISYRSAITHEIEGRVVIEGSTALDRNDPVKADLDLPDIATFGVAQKLTDRWTLMGQATWFGWNNFEEIDPEPEAGAEIAPIVQNYQATWSLAAGAEYQWSDEWAFRGGIQFDETPTVDEYRTSRTPDGDRTWFSLGATYDLNNRLDIDMAGTYIHIDEETINVTRNGGLATINADTEGQVGILSVGLTYKF